MSTTRIKEKISKLVSGHVPEFIKSDYTTFVSFIEAYYRFLEQDQGALEVVQNAKEYGDIDRTVDSFVNYFIANYAQDIGYNAVVDKRLLVKRIKDLYEAKGSEISFKILFKLLYDTVVDTSHPYDNVLIASGGTWDQKVSLRIEITSGSIENIVDRFLTITKNNIVYTDAVIRVKLLETNLYEVFLKASSITPYAIGDSVSVISNNSTIFTGVVRPTTASTSIAEPGTGFKAGQIFNIPLSGGINTLIRILAVNDEGGIVSLRILNFGYNYPADKITINLFNDLTVATRAEVFNTVSGGFKDSLVVTSPHTAISPTRYFFSDYIDNYAYTGNLLATASSDQTVTAATTIGNRVSSSAASITIGMGALARYPGQFTTSQGFISEPEVRIQDDKLYQPFAYQLASELDISVFYDTVKKLIHPAGTNLFVNRVLSATADISGIINVESGKNVNSELNSVFATLETVSKLIGKVADNDNVVTSAEITSYSLFKPLLDEVSISDIVTISAFKTITDDAQLSEDIILSFNRVESDNVNADDQTDGKTQDYTNISGAAGYFLEQYTENSAPSTSITFS